MWYVELLRNNNHREAADDVPTCDAIIVLAAISSRSFPRVARGGRAAEREAGAVRDGTRPRPGRSIDAALAWVARPSAGRARGFGSGFCRQGGLRRSDDQPICRPSEGGQDVAACVRVGGGAGGPGGGVFVACLCQICRERPADAVA